MKNQTYVVDVVNLLSTIRKELENGVVVECDETKDPIGEARKKVADLAMNAGASFGIEKVEKN